MNLIRVFFTGAVVAVAAACSRDTGATVTPLPPLAAIRYVNAIPDTSPVNFRLVDDRIEFSPNLISATFRGFSVYQALGTGTRDLAIFHDDTLAQYATQVHATAQVAAVDDARYTVVYMGFLRAAGTPADQAVVFTDVIPTPAAGKVALRLIHAGAGLGNVDLIAHRQSQAVPAPQVTNVAYGAASNYIEVDTSQVGGPPTARVADTIIVRVRLTGSAVDLATIRMSVGELGTSSVDPIPGSTTQGTVYTYVLTPRSVVGSKAPQTAAFTAPALLELTDRRPAPTRTFP